MPAERVTVRVESHTTALRGSRTAELITLTNANGVEMRVMTYGATIVSLRVPDRTGTLGDVVLGHDSPAEYIDSSAYFGAVIGRYANRIAKATFTLDGKEYALAANDGPNALHGGCRGFDKAIWSAEISRSADESSVRLCYVSPDGEEGYPGTVHVAVTYTLTAANDVCIDYQATADKATPLNLTQHSYFNLAGSGDILGHALAINADNITPVDATLIPSGALMSVADTPFDFRESQPVGKRIDADHPQLRYGRGYDHNFVINRVEAGLALACVLTEPISGRLLEVRTTEPGVQFYSGNSLDGTVRGKGGVAYGRRAGLCLETQHFPDSPNQPSFPTTIIRPGECHQSRTVWTFGVAR